MSAVENCSLNYCPIKTKPLRCDYTRLCLKLKRFKLKVFWLNRALRKVIVVCNCTRANRNSYDQGHVRCSVELTRIVKLTHVVELTRVVELKRIVELTRGIKLTRVVELTRVQNAV